MRKYIKQIFLVWRKGKGSRRIKVGLITRNSSDIVCFEYIKDGVTEAQRDGFQLYPDFPNINKVYTNNVLESFSQRLTNTERTDIKKYLNYWNIDEQYKDDKFYVLAQTQGLLPTDNFEFLADYIVVKGLSFTSEICALSMTNIPSGTLCVGDDLRWELEPDNEYDINAVKLFKYDTFIGYVKMVHCNVFHKVINESFKVVVKSIEQNGKINRVFISISLQ